MSVVNIVIPLQAHQISFLEECLTLLKRNTTIDHMVEIVMIGTRIEEIVGQAVSIGLRVYDRSGLAVNTDEGSCGYNDAVMAALGRCDHPYIAVLPVTHVIESRDWFGKLQMPLLKVPQCGMTFAFDDMAANTRASYPWNWRYRVAGQVFMLPRQVIENVLASPLDYEADDISTAIRDHLRTIGSACWAVPSCRVWRREIPVL